MIRKLLNATAALALLTGSIAPIQSHAYPDYDYYDYYDAGYFDDTAYDDDWFYDYYDYNYDYDYDYDTSWFDWEEAGLFD